MAQYAVIAGSETEAAGYAEDIASYAEDNDVHVFRVDDFDDGWSGLENCSAALLLGGAEQEVQTYLEEADVPVISEQDYGGTLPLGYRDRVAETLWEALEEGAERGRAEELKDVVSGYDTLAIGIHDNPDPDAISSAIALQHIADHYGVEAEVFYGGEINHQENNALKNKLGIDMNQEEVERDEYDGIALLDTGLSNISVLNPAEGVDIVIDHHPSWEDDADRVAGFYDVRTDRGATAAMMAEYLDLLAIEPGEQVATALVHGIRTDTGDLDSSTGGFTAEDVDAFAAMYRHANAGSLAEIESSTKTAETFDIQWRAWKNREIDGATLFSYVEDVEETDAIPQAAEEFLDLEGIETTIIGGLVPDEEQVRLSVRSSDIKRNVGDALDNLFGGDKSLDGIAGGYGGDATKGGAHLPLNDFMKVGYSESGDNETLHEFLGDWLWENVARPFGKDT